MEQDVQLRALIAVIGETLLARMETNSLGVLTSSAAVGNVEDVHLPNPAPFSPFSIC